MRLFRRKRRAVFLLAIGAILVLTFLNVDSERKEETMLEAPLEVNDVGYGVTHGQRDRVYVLKEIMKGSSFHFTRGKQSNEGSSKRKTIGVLEEFPKTILYPLSHIKQVPGAAGYKVIGKIIEQKAPDITSRTTRTGSVPNYNYKKLTNAQRHMTISTTLKPLTYFAKERHERVNTENPEGKNFRSSHFMTIGGRGRLGNLMFQYASLIGIASLHGYTPVIGSSHVLRSIFNISSKPSGSLENERRQVEKLAGAYDNEIDRMPHTHNWTLSGYFQSWKYFMNASDSVRKEFQFKDQILRDMKVTMSMINKSGRLLVGVHVRRGDMNTNYELKRGYSVADVGYINRSMNYFRRKHKNPLFVVCSDSIAWCRANFPDNDTVFVNSRREVDLAVLAHCNHSIITSGSFGWWGAWLAGGETVYFKDYPREESWLSTQYNKKDYYPPSWIPMS